MKQKQLMMWLLPLVAIAFILSGCGQRGALYLPKPAVKKDVTQPTVIPLKQKPVAARQDAFV